MTSPSASSDVKFVLFYLCKENKHLSLLKRLCLMFCMKNLNLVISVLVYVSISTHTLASCVSDTGIKLFQGLYGVVRGQRSHRGGTVLPNLEDISTLHTLDW